MNNLKAESVQKIYAAWYTGTVDHRFQVEVDIDILELSKVGVLYDTLATSIDMIHSQEALEVQKNSDSHNFRP